MSAMIRRTRRIPKGRIHLHWLPPSICSPLVGLAGMSGFSSIREPRRENRSILVFSRRLVAGSVPISRSASKGVFSKVRQACFPETLLTGMQGLESQALFLALLLRKPSCQAAREGLCKAASLPLKRAPCRYRAAFRSATPAPSAFGSFWHCFGSCSAIRASKDHTNRRVRMQAEAGHRVSLKHRPLRPQGGAATREPVFPSTAISSRDGAARGGSIVTRPWKNGIPCRFYEWVPRLAVLLPTMTWVSWMFLMFLKADWKWFFAALLFWLPIFLVRCPRCGQHLAGLWPLWGSRRRRLYERVMKESKSPFMYPTRFCPKCGFDYLRACDILSQEKDMTTDSAGG